MSGLERISLHAIPVDNVLWEAASSPLVRRAGTKRHFQVRRKSPLSASGLFMFVQQMGRDN